MASDRQRLLDFVVDHGIRHFDAVGQVEAELAGLCCPHPGQPTVGTKCGLGEAYPPFLRPSARVAFGAC